MINRRVKDFDTSKFCEILINRDFNLIEEIHVAVFTFFNQAEIPDSIPEKYGFSQVIGREFFSNNEKFLYYIQ
ncbi:hypothetical protein [Methanobrevibacter sp.]|uniref:hypothetical protein n=1 Tax=Methanobrevibacter sp. TaxID=66852 RepID=UPI00388DBFBD